jgi:hypothetical protein
MALVKHNACLVDEVFVGKESDQGAGFVAPSSNRHILGVCREEEKG